MKQASLNFVKLKKLLTLLMLVMLVKSIKHVSFKGPGYELIDARFSSVELGSD